MFNCTKFLKDYNIDTYTTGKNVGIGWIQIKCPFCSDQSNHGGFNIKSGMYNCWLCGSHFPTEVIEHLLNVSHKEACIILRQYQTGPIYYIKKETTHAEKVIYPEGTEKMSMKHHKYLRERRFKSKKLEKMYNLKGTNHIGDYKFRIICPIYLYGAIISYQARDITNKSILRYKACSKENEVIEHKHTLYNIDNANKDSVIVVEGITDVWRLGKNTVCTFGTKYTSEQAYLLAQKYNRVFIIFDENAEIHAENLGTDLSGLGVEAHTITLESGDPAELPEEEALYMKKQLIGE